MIPIGLGLKLLGLRKAIGSFVAKYWPYILAAIAIGILVWRINIWYNGKLDESFKSGQESVREEVKKRIEEQNKINKAVNKSNKEGIEQFVKKTIEDSIKRNDKSNKLARDIAAMVAKDEKYAQCVVDQDVTNARNKIRELGPQ